MGPYMWSPLLPAFSLRYGIAEGVATPATVSVTGAESDVGENQVKSS